jgi:hypothetical protein
MRLSFRPPPSHGPLSAPLTCAGKIPRRVGGAHLDCLLAGRHFVPRRLAPHLARLLDHLEVRVGFDKAGPELALFKRRHFRLSREPLSGSGKSQPYLTALLCTFHLSSSRPFEIL